MRPVLGPPAPRIGHRRAAPGEFGVADVEADRAAGNVDLDSASLFDQRERSTA